MRTENGGYRRDHIQREYTKYRASKGLPNQSVRYISEAELQEIYAGNSWKPMLGDLWPKGPDQIVFDIAVNSGTGRAPQIMRAAMGNPTGGVATLARLATQSRDQVGIVKRACARRASFYRSLRTFSAFGRGWLARNARIEAIGVKMCLEAQNVDLRGVLQREATGAQVKAKRSAQGDRRLGGRRRRRARSSGHVVLGLDRVADDRRGRADARADLAVAQARRARQGQAVDKAIRTTPASELQDKLAAAEADAQAKYPALAEIAKAEAEAEAQARTAAETQLTMRAELAAGDPLQRWWRPLYGLELTLECAALAIVIIPDLWGGDTSVLTAATQAPRCCSAIGACASPCSASMCRAARARRKRRSPASSRPRSSSKSSRRCGSDRGICFMDRNEVEHVARVSGKEAAQETLIGLGIDTTKPIETQRDFAHLRWWREIAEGVMKAAVIAMALGFGGTLGPRGMFTRLLSRQPACRQVQ